MLDKVYQNAAAVFIVCSADPDSYLGGFRGTGGKTVVCLAEIIGILVAQSLDISLNDAVQDSIVPVNGIDGEDIVLIDQIVDFVQLRINLLVASQIVNLLTDVKVRGNRRENNGNDQNKEHRPVADSLIGFLHSEPPFSASTSWVFSDNLRDFEGYR